MTAAAIAWRVRKGLPACGSAEVNCAVLMMPAKAAHPPAIMKLAILMRLVRTPISRAPTMLLPVAIVWRPKVVRLSTTASAAMTRAAHRNGVKAVKPCQDRSGSAGSNRLSPKIALKGSCTGATIGWLL